MGFPWQTITIHQINYFNLKIIKSWNTYTPTMPIYYTIPSTYLKLILDISDKSHETTN